MESRKRARAAASLFISPGSGGRTREGKERNTVNRCSERKRRARLLMKEDRESSSPLLKPAERNTTISLARRVARVARKIKTFEEEEAPGPRGNSS